MNSLDISFHWQKMFLRGLHIYRFKGRWNYNWRGHVSDWEVMAAATYCDRMNGVTA